MRPICLLLCFAAFSCMASAEVFTLSGVSDPLCNSDYEICITSNSFNITINPAGGGFYELENVTGNIITELTFAIPYADTNCPSGTPATPPVNILASFTSRFASSGFASNETVSCDSTPGVADFLLNLSFTPGIPNYYAFDVDLNTPYTDTSANGVGGWLPNASTTNYDNVPEPATLAACVSGLALVYLLGRRGFRY